MTADELYAVYHPKVSAYVRSRVANYHDAEDLVARVFEKVFIKLPSFDAEKASLSTWIYTITRNTVTDHFRKGQPTAELIDPSVYEAEPAGDADEALAQLADGLLTLKAQERDILLLHYYDDLTLKDTAERMGISYAYVKVLHRNALNGLRGFYAENGLRVM